MSVLGGSVLGTFPYLPLYSAFEQVLLPGDTALYKCFFLLLLLLVVLLLVLNTLVCLQMTMVCVLALFTRLVTTAWPKKTRVEKFALCMVNAKDAFMKCMKRCGYRDTSGLLKGFCERKRDKSHERCMKLYGGKRSRKPPGKKRNYY